MAIDIQVYDLNKRAVCRSCSNDHGERIAARINVSYPAVTTQFYLCMQCVVDLTEELMLLPYMRAILTERCSAPTERNG